ncbi:MAG: hypothetical protein QHH18_02700 [Candidatus Bathyarchaeota archaeon]|nr:hypothetical protein [Candidatus Bathyarchaeota archaeon]
MACLLIFTMLIVPTASISSNPNAETSFHNVTVDMVNGEFALCINPLVAVSPSCEGDAGCEIYGESFNCNEGCTPEFSIETLSLSVLMDTENQKVMLLVYEINETLQEMVISTNVLWSYIETSNQLNRSASLSKFRFVVEENSLELLMLKYIARHAGFTVSLFTILYSTCSGIYNNSRTGVSYMPANKSEIKSAEFVSFNYSVTLSEHYTILSEVASEIGSLYASSQNISIQQLASAYYTMENEISYLSEIVRIQLQNYDNEILKAGAILTDVDCGVLCGAIMGGVCFGICGWACGCFFGNIPCCVGCGVVCGLLSAFICGFLCGDIPSLCSLGCAAVCGAGCALDPVTGVLCDQVCNVGCLQLIGSLCGGAPPPGDGGGGGGGCPFVYIWNGTQYVLVNNLLPASLMHENDIEDYYCLDLSLVRRDGKYHLIIGEFQNEHSYIDELKLIAVDHDPNLNIAVTSDGEILTYRNPLAPVWCLDDNGNIRLNEISFMDGNISDPTTYFEGYPDDYIILNFGKVDSSNAKLIFRTDVKKEFECIEVQVKNSSGAWQTIKVLTPRAYWCMEAVSLSPYITKDEDLMVRLLWKSHHRLDYVGLDLSPQEDVEIRYANLVSALHFDEGDVKAKLKNSDGIHAELIPGQFMKLEFTLPQNAKEARTLNIMHKRALSYYNNGENMKHKTQILFFLFHTQDFCYKDILLFYIGLKVGTDYGNFHGSCFVNTIL